MSPGFSRASSEQRRVFNPHSPRFTRPDRPVTRTRQSRKRARVRTRTDMELQVRAVSARNLLDKQTFGKQDPYCKLTLRGKSQRTRVHDNGRTCVAGLGGIVRLEERDGLTNCSRLRWLPRHQTRRPCGTRSSRSRWWTRSWTSSSSRSRTRTSPAGAASRHAPSRQVDGHPWQLTAR